MAPEFHQIGMCYVPVRHIDRKRVGGIAASALRVKDEIPGTVVRGPGFGSRGQREARKKMAVAITRFFMIRLQRNI
jgi:hypothetical protein